MKKIVISMLAIGLILNFLPVVTATVQNNQSSGENAQSQNVPHDSIYIYSDSDFTSENGVTGGTGSINDPYEISGWDIEEIYICGPSEKISKYFEINNCKILGKIFLRSIEDGRCKIIENCEFIPTSEYDHGIYSGGYMDYFTVENCIFYLNHSTGISTSSSSNAIVRNCEFYSQQVYSRFGIFIGDYSLIEDCYFVDSYVGIHTRDYTTIRNCIFENSDDEGIVVRGDYNLIEDCIFNDEDMGIEISTEQHNATIKNCTFNNNLNAIASYVMDEEEKYSCDHIIENCEFKNCIAGIDIYQSERITIRDCVFENCNDKWWGSIRLTDHPYRPQITRDCEIYNNYFLNNELAISIESSNRNKVVDNVFFNNYFSGNIQNVKQIYEGKLNKQQWSIEKIPGTNIIGGSFLGGNFWDDYDGYDSDGDGLGDEAYWINENEAKDKYPLFNPPPTEPTISGPANGNPGEEYEYTFVATDPNGDDVCYFVDWGDDTTSGWTDFVPSGSMITLTHAWDEEDDYTIKAKAKDIHGAESDWGYLDVTMPVNNQNSQSSQSSSSSSSSSSESSESGSSSSESSSSSSSQSQSSGIPSSQPTTR